MNHYILPVCIGSESYCDGCPALHQTHNKGLWGNIISRGACYAIQQKPELRLVEEGWGTYFRDEKCPLQSIKPAPSCESCKHDGTLECVNCCANWNNYYEPREKEQGK